jgi:hypothetical protein
LEDETFPVARKKIKKLTYYNYEKIIAETTIEEVAEAQAIPGSAPAPAPAKVKPAKVKPGPAPAKVKPANPTLVPVPANPAHAQGEEATLRRAGASRVSSGQAQTKVEGQSEGQSEGQTEGQSEGQIQAQTQVERQAPTQVERQAPTQVERQAPTQVERQSEEQIGEAVKRGQGEEENQIFRPDESNSGNMFVIPLMGVVLALAITFLVKK